MMEKRNLCIWSAAIESDFSHGMVIVDGIAHSALSKDLFSNEHRISNDENILRLLLPPIRDVKNMSDWSTHMRHCMSYLKACQTITFDKVSIIAV